MLGTEIDSRVDVFLLSKFNEDFKGVVAYLEKIRIAGRVLAGLCGRLSSCTIGAHATPSCA